MNHLSKHIRRIIAASTLTAIVAANTPAFSGVNDLLPKPQEIITDGQWVKGSLPVISDIVGQIEGIPETPLEGFPPEGYTIVISDSAIKITAASERGVIRAQNTLDQLRDGAGDSLPVAEIRDWPAFPLRGFMHDTGRSFIPVDTLMRQIDLLSRFKINTFHWHLTENQAWRLAIGAFPQLTADTSMVRHAGKYYTPDDCRRLEAFAAERGVTVIPEIDMPGHSAAFRRAMGFDMQSDEGEAALLAIIDEACKAFPLAPYFHIGGDEVPIRRKGFLRRMTDHVRSLGKKAIVWNPIHGTTINDSVGADMTQMWSTAGKAVKGIPNIDCRYIYANHFDPYADVASVYRSNIYYQPKSTPEVAGSIIAFWNDRRLPDAAAIARDNSLYPATLAMAERAWRGGGDGYFEEIGCVLPAQGKELNDFADWEKRFLHYKDTWLADEPIAYARQSDIRWHISNPVALDADPDTTSTYTVAGGTVYLRHTWGDIVPGVFRNVSPGVKALVRARVWSDCDTLAGAYIDTQNYSRSEIDLPAERGKWDRKGSEILLNGKPVKAPDWDNAGIVPDHETLLLNENSTARRPTPVRLRKGWNTIETTLPFVKTEGIRLNKWMLTFVFTDSSGKHSLDCIRYE